MTMLDQDAATIAAALIRAQFDPDCTGDPLGPILAELADDPIDFGGDPLRDRELRATAAVALTAHRRGLTTAVKPDASETELREVTVRLTAVLFAAVAQAGYYAHRYAAVAGRSGLAVADEVVVTLQLRDIEG
jgi:hypothetical protein